MNEKEFFELFNKIDEAILKDVLADSYKQGQDHYNKLIVDGWDPEQAAYDTMMKTSYRSMKYAVMVSLLFAYNVDPEKPKSKEELKRLFKIIK